MSRIKYVDNDNDNADNDNADNDNDGGDNDDFHLGM